MDKTTFQEKMNWGMKQCIEAFGKTIVLEYTKVGSSTKVKQNFTGTFEKFTDDALRDQTVYTKESMIFKILVTDLFTALGINSTKTLNSPIIIVNNKRYNIIAEEISSDEVLLKLYSNTV